jgi:phosphoesterase RecJ-like protein
MDKEHKQLKRLIEGAKNILVVSHRGPDMDAFCSMLLVKEFLNIYYPSKNVVAKAKQMPNFNIPRMHDITVVETLDEGDEDLIIVVDTNELNIVCDKGDGLINSNKNVVVIDHHKTSSDRHKVVINQGKSSASEQVISSFRQILGKKFQLTKEIAELGQYGISADTGRFLYDLTTADTFRLYADLYEFSPVDLEELDYKSRKIPMDSTVIIIELLDRLTIEGDMAYTYVNIEDSKRWRGGDISEALNFVKNEYLRYIQSVHWGFVLKPSVKGDHNWWISFRSTKGYQEVDKIAEDLGGGGHIYASGAKLLYSEPRTLEQVLTDVLTVIKKHVATP